MPRTDRRLMEGAYESIKARIISLDLPPGGRLDDRALSLELGLSRTPVREAAFRLVAEGFVDLGAGSSFVVHPIDLLEMPRLFEAHLLIARAVARLAAQRVTPVQLEGLREAAERVDSARKGKDHAAMTSHNAAFHRLEAEAADNVYIGAAAQSILDHERRLAYLAYGGMDISSSPGLEEHLEAVSRQHHRMLNALELRDVDEAERIAVEHLQGFRRRFDQLLGQNALADFALT